jgi:cysteine desulfurase
MSLPADYIYLDNAAATKVDDEAVKAMLPYMTDFYAVASSQFSHQPGILAMEALDGARTAVGAKFGVSNEEVVFTSDAAESNNLAIKGFALQNSEKGKHLITSKLEAYSVLNSFTTLEKEGFTVTRLGVDSGGLINPDDLQKAITDQTILVSVQWVNQEIGTIQAIEKLAAICDSKGVAFHTDASHAAAKIDIDLKKVPVTMLTLSANYFHGPKGAAALIVRKGTKLQKLIDGGFMEFDLRAGVENVPAIVGMAKALEVFKKDRLDKIRELDSYLLPRLLKIEESDLNGNPAHRLPGIINVSFYRAEGESVILHLDMKGIAVITGSACFSRSLEPSYVLMAMGHSHERAHGSIRYALSHYNTIKQMTRVAEATGEIVSKLRELSPIKKAKV